ncbi:MAG: hypothetical protein L0I80_03610, partial [Brevibacterium sp.]|nr:hypothetical protein [Brevibacterium sp.]
MGCASVVAHLREAGCVFAEDEARILMQTAQECSFDRAERYATLVELLARRVAGEPLEQVVGWVEFAGLRIAVAPGVFVPRQRTTLLATQSIKAVQSVKAAGRGVKDAACAARFLE